MDQLNFIPIGHELKRNGDAENENDELSDAEFMTTPLNLLANDPLTNPNQSRAQSPRTLPTFPGRSTAQGHETMNLMNLEPERSLEWDNLRQIKHADPYGRVTLGRKFSFRTFIVETLTDGAFFFRPAVIMEERQFDRIRNPKPDTRHPITDLFLRCPTMR